ncbi:MAG: hypothetical protein JOZ08_07190 [Verrucomicrobia bacterium]|nr:hypothetical protein [Verrucomicrobiota bacterium]
MLDSGPSLSRLRASAAYLFYLQSPTSLIMIIIIKAVATKLLVRIKAVLRTAAVLAEPQLCTRPIL